MQFEYVDINSLIPYEKNTRKHTDYDVEKIAKSIEKYGMNDPVGVWNNIIVEGHGRIEACKKLGIKEVPIIRLDHLTDKQRREYGILHNKTAELSMWDYARLDEEVAELDFSDFDFDVNFTDTEEINIDDLFVEDNNKEKKPKMVTCPHCGEEFDLNEV